MRRLFLALPFALALPVVARSDEVTDFRDRVLKAAAKDPADIKKFKMFVMKAKGTSTLGPEPVPAAVEVVGVYPGKMKATLEMGADKNKAAVSLCANDDRGWRHEVGFASTELPVAELNDFRTDVNAIFASTLFSLAEPETKLALVGPSKVEGEEVVGLKVSRRPFPEVTLYFGAKSNLLRKMAYRGRENGVVMSKEMVFGGHKEFAGLMLPTTQTTSADGKKVYDWTALEFSFPDKLDGDTFTKP